MTRRRETRLVAVTGDQTTRVSMTGVGARAKLRWTMLVRVLTALEAARNHRPIGGGWRGGAIRSTASAAVRRRDPIGDQSRRRLARRGR